MMIRNVVNSVGFLILAISTCAFAADEVVASPPSSCQDSELMKLDRHKSPLSLSEGQIDLGPVAVGLGPQDDGSFGSTIKGTESTPLKYVLFDCSKVPDEGIKMRPVFHLDYAIDGGWSTASQSHNAIAISLKPTISTSIVKYFRHVDPDQVSVVPVIDKEAGKSAPHISLTPQSDDPMAPRILWWLGTYGDFRFRSGEFASKNETFVRAEQAVYGGGLQTTWDDLVHLQEATASNPIGGYWQGLFVVPPSLSVGYYGVSQLGNTSAPIPDDVKANFAQATVDIQLRLPWFGISNVTASPLQLKAEQSASVSTNGGWHGYDGYSSLSLVYITHNKIKPAITFKTGKDGGFEYDRQLILGVLWDFAADELFK